MACQLADVKQRRQGVSSEPLRSMAAPPLAGELNLPLIMA